VPPKAVNGASGGHFGEGAEPLGTLRSYRDVRASDIASILPAVAKLRGVTPEALGAMILRNFRRAVSMEGSGA